MTIRVCHNAFNKGLKYTGRILWYSLQFGIMGAFIFCLINISEPNPFCQTLDEVREAVCEQRKISPYHFGAVTMGIIGGFILLMPKATGDETIFETINRKLGLFSWREDC